MRDWSPTLKDCAKDISTSWLSDWERLSIQLFQPLENQHKSKFLQKTQNFKAQASQLSWVTYLIILDYKMGPCEYGNCRGNKGWSSESWSVEEWQQKSISVTGRLKGRRFALMTASSPKIKSNYKSKLLSEKTVLHLKIVGRVSGPLITWIIWYIRK